MTKLSELVGEHDPVITVALIRSRGTLPIYQANIGAETRGSADDICKKIKTAGVACLALRNAPMRNAPTKKAESSVAFADTDARLCLLPTRLPCTTENTLSAEN